MIFVTAIFRVRMELGGDTVLEAAVLWGLHPFKSRIWFVVVLTLRL